MSRKRNWTVLICSCLLAFAGSLFQDLPLGGRLREENRQLVATAGMNIRTPPSISKQPSIVQNHHLLTGV
ncbi:hypothetical protein RvY_19017 [Ramazzottius varieornatus]|uniref:Uncharacterized protein n=1 Tax=Ramazzottius varieornatus TaxID=947166 RepID=A0A1D1WAE4_RAMVA|nr:hypothetical protein RvY_19017 [Ramazzottius varieornatus]